MNKIKKKPIKGTLYFAMIAVVITPIMEINRYRQSVMPFSFDSIWLQISNPALDTYDYEWVRLVNFEFIGSIILILFSILLILLFMIKTRHFTKFIIIYFMIKIVFIAFLFYLRAIYRGPATPTLDEIKSIGAVLVFVTGIWIPYFLLSERVNETFIY